MSNPATNPEATLNATPPKPPNRIGVVEMFYHEVADQVIRSIESRFFRVLKTDEQYYTHACKADGHWRPLELGWLQECGMLVITNEPTKFNAIPTKEQKEEAASKILEIAIAPAEETGRTMLSPAKPQPVACFIIHPGESMRVTPVDVRQIRVRCRNGETRFTPVVFPL